LLFVGISGQLRELLVNHGICRFLKMTEYFVVVLVVVLGLL